MPEKTGISQGAAGSFRGRRRASHGNGRWIMKYMMGKKKSGAKPFFLYFMFALLIGTCFLFCLTRTVSADQEKTGSGEETEEKTEEEILEGIRARRDGIVHIESICWNGEGEIYKTKSYSGFVVSGDSTGIYVVTVHSGLTYTSEEKESLKEKYELENNTRISEKIEVIFDGDLRIEASIVGESSQRDLTVLKLGQTVHFDNILQFSKDDVSDKERVFLLAFPKSLQKKGGIYNEENVEITSGTILSSYQEDEVGFLEHDIQTDSHSLGGPLLNEDGIVVGVLLTSGSEEKGTAISSGSVKAFLKTLNVGYGEYEEVAEEKKLPIFNIVLGAVIAALLLAVVIRLVRNRAFQEKDGEGGDFRNAKGMKNSSGKRVNAWLEYPSEKRRVPIQKTNFIIGRSEETDFAIQGDKGISRSHACIQFDGKSFYLTDMRSKNHTFLNGHQLMPGERRRLKSGDEITAGGAKLRFRA